MGGIADMVDYVFNGAPSKSPAAPPAALPDAPSTDVPSTDDAATQKKMDEAAQAQSLSLSRGRTSTMLTGGAGLTDMGKTSKLLLGQ